MEFRRDGAYYNVSPWALHYDERYYLIGYDHDKRKCKNEMANVIIDQFGKDVKLVPVDEECFTVKVNVAVSSQFLSWVIALEGNAVITGPEEVKGKMQALVRNEFVGGFA